MSYLGGLELQHGAKASFFTGRSELVIFVERGQAWEILGILDVFEGEHEGKHGTKEQA
jgi:hypothetical protein